MHWKLQAPINFAFASWMDFTAGHEACVQNLAVVPSYQHKIKMTLLPSTMKNCAHHCHTKPSKVFASTATSFFRLYTSPLPIHRFSRRPYAPLSIKRRPCNQPEATGHCSSFVVIFCTQHTTIHQLQLMELGVFFFFWFALDEQYWWRVFTVMVLRHLCLTNIMPSQLVAQNRLPVSYTGTRSRSSCILSQWASTVQL